MRHGVLNSGCLKLIACVHTDGSKQPRMFLFGSQDADFADNGRDHNYYVSLVTGLNWIVVLVFLAHRLCLEDLKAGARWSAVTINEWNDVRCVTLGPSSREYNYSDNLFCCSHVYGSWGTEVTTRLWRVGLGWYSHNDCVLRTTRLWSVAGILFVTVE